MTRRRMSEAELAMHAGEAGACPDCDPGSEGDAGGPCPKHARPGGERWWKVSGVVTVSAYQYVRATSADEAKRKTNLAEGVLCPYGPEQAGTTPLEQPIIEEADGTFVPTEATEEDPDPEWLETDTGGEDNENG